MAPTTPEQIVGIAGGMKLAISLGLLTAAAYWLADSIDRGWLRRSPDGYLPGIVEREQWTVDPREVGRLPLLLGSVGAIGMGLATYLLGGFAVLLTVFFTVLFNGQSPAVMKWLYAAAGLGILVTVSFQMILTYRIQNSKWYLGY